MSPSKAQELRERRRGTTRGIDPDAEPILPPPVPHHAVLPGVTPTPTPEPVPVPVPVPNVSRETSESRKTSEERAASANPATWSSTLDDPAVLPGRMQARSNYVEDTAFARYRAAIYWLARNPDAIEAGVPENVSAGVNTFLEREASRLEKRFNAGNPFPATPEQVKKAKTKRASR